CRASRAWLAVPEPFGFRSTQSAPARSACIDTDTSPDARLPVTTTIGVGAAAMISRVASKPSRFGIAMSMVTTSGRRRCVSSTASRPSRASATTSIAGSLASTAIRCARAVGETSATRTRIIVRSEELRDRVEEAAVVEGALREVGVGAGLEPARLVGLALEPGQQHDREIAEAGAVPDRARQRAAIHAWHVDVAHDHVGAVLLQEPPRRLAVDRHEDLVAGGLEEAPLERARRDRIVAQEDALPRDRRRALGRREPTGGGVRERAAHEVRGVQDEGDAP